MITTHSIGSKADPKAFLNRSLSLFMPSASSGGQGQGAQETGGTGRETKS